MPRENAIRGSRAISKREAGRISTGSSSYGAEQQRDIARGAIKQRDLDSALRKAGGRRGPAANLAREAVESSRRHDVLEANPRATMKGVGESFKRMDSRVTALQKLAGSRQAAERLLKGAARGMFSPAGLAEGVAGTVVKKSYDEGKKILEDSMNERRSKAMHAKDKAKMPAAPKPGKTRT